jgi:hypothetical protein
MHWPARYHLICDGAFAFISGPASLFIGLCQYLYACCIYEPLCSAQALRLAPHQNIWQCWAIDKRHVIEHASGMGKSVLSMRCWFGKCQA